MSNRPGHIKDIIRTDLERPRHYDVQATPRFQAFYKGILDSIREELIAGGRNWLTHCVAHVGGHLRCGAVCDEPA